MHREFLTQHNITKLQLQNAVSYLEQHNYSSDEAVRLLSWAFFAFYNEILNNVSLSAFQQKLDDNPKLEALFTNPDYEPHLGRTLLAFLRTYVSQHLEDIQDVLGQEPITVTLSHPEDMDTFPEDVTDVHISNTLAANYKTIKALLNRFPTIQVVSIPPSIAVRFNGNRNKELIERLLRTHNITYIITYAQKSQTDDVGEAAMLES